MNYNMYAKYFSEIGRQLKVSLLPQCKNKNCKVLIQDKKDICDSSTTISTTSLNNNYLKVFTRIILSRSFKIRKTYLTQQTFS